MYKYSLLQHVIYMFFIFNISYSQICIWSSDFSEASEWIIEHDSEDCSLDWEIGQNLECGGFYPIAPIDSEDGYYAMLDSDEYGGEQGGTETEDSWLTMAQSIDCSGFENIIIEFDTWYQSYNTEKCFIVVSTDGTFPTDLTTDTEHDPANGIYELFPNISGVVQANTGNPFTKRINISESAGGQSEVWIRFNWTGTWGYAWFIDGVCISEQPENDIALNYGLVSHNGTKEQYGRVPLEQLNGQFYSGASVYNFGVNSQDSIELKMDIINSDGDTILSQNEYPIMYAATNNGIPYMDSVIIGPIETDQNIYFEETTTVGSNIFADTYKSVFTVTSSSESYGGEYFSNNIAFREYEFTDGLYSADGIGVYNNPSIKRMGTGSFTGAADGFMMMSYYDISQETTVSGVSILLDSYAYGENALTVPGGELVVAIIDTTLISLGTIDPGNSIAQSDFYVVSQSDIENGAINIQFNEPITLLPDAYFISVEMYSNGNYADIYILDDETIPQPSYLSMIYIPGDQVYSNGTAAAIRMITGEGSLGCMNPAACNYNPNATIADLCDYSCIGCMDESACNYNPNATEDDGACDYSIPCVGCMYAGACNYNPNATVDNNTCVFVIYDCDYCENGIVIDGDIDNDGVCSEDEIGGCTDNSACNYDAEATENNESCEYESCAGCMDETACNYDIDATINAPWYCINPWYGYDCDENCLVDADNDGLCDSNGDDLCPNDPENDIDGDGVCADEEILGCTYSNFCNYNPYATEEDLSCITDCAGLIEGCMNPFACNYNSDAELDNGSCYVDCTDDDVTITLYGEVVYVFWQSCEEFVSISTNEYGFDPVSLCNSLVDFLFGTELDESYTYTYEICECACSDFIEAQLLPNSCDGCIDEEACNYDPNAFYDDESCEYESCVGCLDPTACNYDENATIDNGLCDYLCLGCNNQEQIEMFADPEGAYIMQLIDGELSLDPLIAEYDTLTAFPNAVEGSLYEAVVGVRIPNDTSFVYDLGSGPQLFENMQINSIAINSIVVSESTSGNTELPDGFSWECIGGSETPSECVWNGGEYGCINFGFDVEVPSGFAGAYRLNIILDVSANWDFLGFPIPIDITVDDFLTDYVLVISDQEEEIPGCTEDSACNYDSSADYNDGSCEYVSCSGNTTNPGACNYNPEATIELDAEFESCAGCLDPTACDYNENATIPVECDYSTCVGCMDPTSCSFDPDATISIPEDCVDWDSCVGCIDLSACNYDSNATISTNIFNDESCDYSCIGCMDEGSCNYDSLATLDYSPELSEDGNWEICDYETCAGCTDDNGINYNPDFTLNDGSCIFLGDDVLWYEGFSDSNISNVITEDISGYGDWVWSTEPPGGQWSENTGIIESDTPENGFMLMAADFYNTSPQNGVAEGEVGENQINATFTIGPVDLSSSETEELVLQFYSDYRICCYYPNNSNNDLNVYISTDGGATFSDLDYIEGNIYEVNVQTQTLSQIPLGNFSPNTSDVYFKFEWIGTHYYWMIDDLSIIQRPAYDLKMQSAWLTMEDPTNIEYYSIPENQMPDEMLIGAEVYNYGYNDDLNVTLNGSIISTSYGSSIDSDIIESDSTAYIETDYFDISMLNAGTYEFRAEILSSGDEVTPEDNNYTREFVISENIYSIDGLYDAEEWIGTGWPGGDDTADGVRYANYFAIKQSTTLSSISILLDTDSHPTSLGTYQTEAGGEIIAYVCDTTGIFDPLVETLEPEFGGALWISDFYLVSDSDVSNGMVVIDVPELDLDPNAYYIVVEFYSNGLTSDILIRDDTSVPQPWWASLVFYPTDQTWYSNPNAASIHLGLDGFENSLSDHTLAGIECFPNPSNGYIQITTDEMLNGKSTMRLFNILGENIEHYEVENLVGTSIEFDVSHLSPGSYILEVENKNKFSRHKLIVE